MNYGKEFRKFATKHQGVNALYYDKIVGAMTPKNMTSTLVKTNLTLQKMYPLKHHLTTISIVATFCASLTATLPKNIPSF